MEPIHPTYLYNGQGHALSAQIVRPFHELIEVQAGMSLPTIGGFGAASVSDFRFRDLVSFDRASTHVSGSFNDDDQTYTTMVTSSIENLNFCHVVTAERVVVRLTSRHLLNEPEPEISFLGSHFDNLRIGGYPVEVDLDLDLFSRADTFRKLLAEIDSNKAFRKMALDPYHTGKALKRPDENGTVLCSLVKDMNAKCPGVKRDGHVFAVPGFGRVFVAEVVAEDSHRILTMLRFRLGSPVGGSGTAAQAQSNGQQYPPPPGK